MALIFQLSLLVRRVRPATYRKTATKQTLTHQRIRTQSTIYIPASATAYRIKIEKLRAVFLAGSFSMRWRCVCRHFSLDFFVCFAILISSIHAIWSDGHTERQSYAGAFIYRIDDFLFAVGRCSSETIVWWCSVAALPPPPLHTAMNIVIWFLFAAFV